MYYKALIKFSKMHYQYYNKSIRSYIKARTKIFFKNSLIMPILSLQKPTPAFKGTAVVDGLFKEISLDDYKGQYLVLFFYPLDL